MFKININSELVEVKISIRRKFHTAKCFYGEFFVRRNFHTAKILHGEISVPRNYFTAKFTKAEIPSATALRVDAEIVGPEVRWQSLQIRAPKSHVTVTPTKITSTK